MENKKSGLTLSKSLSEVKDVIKDELRTLEDVQITIPVDATVKPKFYRVHSVLFALKNKLETELKCLVNLGIYQPIPTFSCATTTVTVMMK